MSEDELNIAGNIEAQRSAAASKRETEALEAQLRALEQAQV